MRQVHLANIHHVQLHILLRHLLRVGVVFYYWSGLVISITFFLQGQSDDTSDEGEASGDTESM